MAENVGTLQLEQLSKDLAAASGDKFKDVAKNLVLDAANQTQQFAQAYAPVRTGALRESIHIILSDGGLTAIVMTDVPYAVYVEFGTGVRGEFPGHPITIHAKSGGYLRFQVNGRWVYAKKVVNPGMAPRPFMRPAAERAALPLADNLGNQAVLFIVQGPNAPETLNNAPATSSSAGGHLASADNQRMATALAGAA